jgi:hypothetical protein
LSIVVCATHHGLACFYVSAGYKVVSSTTEYSKATATKEAAREVEAAAAARAATAAAVAAQEAHQAAAASVSDEGVDRATGEENGMVDEALEEHASEAGSAGTHHDAEVIELTSVLSSTVLRPTACCPAAFGRAHCSEVSNLDISWLQRHEEGWLLHKQAVVLD